jgi:hypothetical protein
VNGKSPQGPKVSVHIKQYLLFSAAKLTSCSSPSATAPRLTSSLLPHANLLCRRRKPTVETCVDNNSKLRPQDRLWHYGQVHATQNERHREQWPGHHDQVPCELNAGAGNNCAEAHV